MKTNIKGNNGNVIPIVGGQLVYRTTDGKQFEIVAWTESAEIANYYLQTHVNCSVIDTIKGVNYIAKNGTVCFN